MKIFVEAVGWAGTACIVGAYALASFGFLPADSVGALLLNLAGACLLGSRLVVARVWSGVFLEVMWGSISIFGLFRALFPSLT